MSHSFDFSVFSVEVWEPVKQWVRMAHPDDVDTLYDFSESVDFVRTTPEAIALWEQYTAEFVAETAGS